MFSACCRYTVSSTFSHISKNQNGIQMIIPALKKCLFFSKQVAFNSNSNTPQIDGVQQFLINSNVEKTPRTLYKALVESSVIDHDSRQSAVVEELHALYGALDNYHANPRSSGWFQKLLHKDTNSKMKGLYLYGNVGTGKTMLMDLFYHCVNVEQKQRIHFNSFMLNVHSKIHRLKQSLPKHHGTKPKPYDPIGPVAKEISEESSLLCFDEFQVTDIADAMILKRLFIEMFRNGVVMVATSNRRPEDLYKGGLQRSNFVPFISILKEHCKSFSIDSAVDYRMMGLPYDGQVYLMTSDSNVETKMDQLLMFYADKYSQVNNSQPTSRTLRILGRDLVVSKCSGYVASFTFEELCMQPVGAVDYIELCKVFDVILLRNVPQMNIFRKTEARRFISLIDTIYDAKVGLVISAETRINSLFVRATDHEKKSVMRDGSIILDDLQLDQSDDSFTLNIFSGEEEEFAFQRALSRLNEMQTVNYWKNEVASRQQRRLKKT